MILQETIVYKLLVLELMKVKNLEEALQLLGSLISILYKYEIFTVRISFYQQLAKKNANVVPVTSHVASLASSVNSTSNVQSSRRDEYSPRRELSDGSPVRDEVKKESVVKV